MHLNTFIILIVVFIAIAVVAEIMLRRQGESKTPSELAAIEKKVTAGVAKVIDEAKGVGGKVWQKKQPDLVVPFKQWVSDNLDEDELKTWLISLSDEQLRALTEHLVTFCHDLNLELSWLIQQKLELDPKLKQVVYEMVIAYCSTCQQATQVA